MTQSTFSFAFQQAPIGMAIVQTDGTLLQMNNWLHTLCGCAEQELMGQRFHDLLYPEDRHVYEQIVKVSEDGPSSAPVIVRLIGRDSTITQVKLTVQLVEKTETEPPNVLVFINTLSDPLTSERMIQTIKGWDQSLFLHNPAMIVSVNLKGYIYAANEAAEQITGYAIEDLIGQEGYMFLDDEQDVLHNNLYQGTSFEQPVAYEARIRRKDGKLIEMGMKNVPIIIDGKVAGLYLIGRDITEIKQSLASKEKAELELWETLQNQQGMTFKFKKMNGEFIHTLCDGKLLYRMGLTPDEVVGKTLREFAVLEGTEAKERHYCKAWEGQEVLYEGKSRTGIWYLASLRPILKDGVVQEVIASCVDITEKKKAEMELAEVQEKFQSLFLSSPLAISLLDTDGNVIGVNPAHEAVYGWKNDEIMGMPLPVYPDHLKVEYHLLKTRVMNDEQVQEYETEHIRKEGSLITISLTVAPLRDKAGKRFGYACISRDITENKQTEEILRKADRLNVVGQLAAGLAHEIRNPLTAIRGFLQLIRKGQQKDTFFTMMLSELDRINNILSELLIVSKPQVTQFQRKDLVQLLKDVLNLLNPQSILQSVRYRTFFEAEQLFVNCSETELKQVFINIIKNGIEAMPNGGILTVKLKLTRDNKIIIRIIDQGVGIPKDRIPRLGEPFYTTKEGGTGLGLMMCNKIIDSHKGTIAISSKENAGTAVDVVLPLG